MHAPRTLKTASVLGIFGIFTSEALDKASAAIAIRFLATFNLSISSESAPASTTCAACDLGKRALSKHIGIFYNFGSYMTMVTLGF